MDYNRFSFVTSQKYYYRSGTLERNRIVNKNINIASNADTGGDQVGWMETNTGTIQSEEQVNGSIYSLSNRNIAGLMGNGNDAEMFQNTFSTGFIDSYNDLASSWDCNEHGKFLNGYAKTMISFFPVYLLEIYVVKDSTNTKVMDGGLVGGNDRFVAYHYSGIGSNSRTTEST